MISPERARNLVTTSFTFRSRGDRTPVEPFGKQCLLNSYVSRFPRPLIKPDNMREIFSTGALPAKTPLALYCSFIPKTNGVAFSSFSVTSPLSLKISFSTFSSSSGCPLLKLSLVMSTQTTFGA